MVIMTAESFSMIISHRPLELEVNETIPHTSKAVSLLIYFNSQGIFSRYMSRQIVESVRFHIFLVTSWSGQFNESINLELWRILTHTRVDSSLPARMTIP